MTVQLRRDRESVAQRENERQSLFATSSASLENILIHYSNVFPQNLFFYLPTTH